MAAEATGGKPRYMAAIITSVAPDAVAEPIGDRVLALLGVSEEVGGAESAASRAREIIRRLRPHGPAAASSVHSDPAEAGRALEEAELMLDVVTRDPRLAERFAEGIPTGVYRLLFRALASNPAEVVRFYEDTVAPLVEHDRDYRTDLLNTLEAYLDCDCNMRATAEAVYAHRHTVAHRLDRIRELTGLDPSSGEDRERLGLGIKAYRLIEPTLPR
jgi:DNA-binding PucR family transcriptional regulator